MEGLVVSAVKLADEEVEVVEQKGLGRPDTICDALTESFSCALCREYRHRFGDILHHNVDKALLWGGRAIPMFGGGEVVSPISIYLAGRATSEVGTERIPITDIAIESSRAWLRANIHALNPERHVRINALSHVAKIYNVVARQIAEGRIAEFREIARARCLIVSQIGAPVTCPALMAVNVSTHDSHSVTELRNYIEAIAADQLARIPALVDDFVSRKIELY